MDPDPGKYDEHDSCISCTECGHEFARGEPMFVISTQLEEQSEGRMINVLAGQSDITLCRDCAENAAVITLERPFAEMLRHFQ